MALYQTLLHFPTLLKDPQDAGMVDAYEVSSKYDMERGDQKQPEETKAHTTKREWQVAQQEQELNILEDKKALLEFDIQAAKSKKDYETKKAEQAKEQRQNIQDEIEELQNKNNELLQRNDELYNNRYEEFRKYQKAIELRQNVESEIKELSKKQNQLQKYLNRIIETIKDWKNEVTNKINSINEVVDEYKDFADETEHRYSQEIMSYALNALGDVPESPQMDFEAPTAGFTTYDEEEYEL